MDYYKDGLAYGCLLVSSGNVHAAFVLRSDAREWAEVNGADRYKVVEL